DAKLAVLRLEGDHSQAFLNVIQNIINDETRLLSTEQTLEAQQLVIGLAVACDQLPSSLCVTGVTKRGADPVCNGGFGDIYQASYNGGKVALKRMRRFQSDASKEIRRVNSTICM
ncbi:hypothetical protein C8R44DRAFT_608983, partial [Mycena epipterygia]